MEIQQNQDRSPSLFVSYETQSENKERSEKILGMFSTLKDLMEKLIEQNSARPRQEATVGTTSSTIFLNLGVLRHKVFISFPHGSNPSLDGILPQTLNDLTAKSNGQTGLEFVRALTSLVKVILEGKVTYELRLSSFARN